jgi:hypothetical protein
MSPLDHHSVIFRLILLIVDKFSLLIVRFASFCLTSQSPDHQLDVLRLLE